MPALPRNSHLYLMGVLLAAGVKLSPTLAGPASADIADTAQLSTTAKSDADNSGNDITRPINSFEVRFRYQPSSSPDSTTEKEYALLRATTRIDLDQGWKVSLYAQTEGVDKQTSSAKSGSTEDWGLGDSVAQAVLIRELDKRWAFGVGARVVTPTAEDSLGTGKWQVMPGFGVRYTFSEEEPDSFFVPAFRYAVSVAGTHTTRDISELQMAPTLNLDLPGKWFLTLYPSYDIRINYGVPVAGQSGRLFLPADAEIGCKLTDQIVMALEGSVPIVKDYPVYNYKIQFRIIVKN